MYMHLEQHLPVSKLVNVMCKHTQWSARAKYEAQEEGAKWAEGLLNTAGLQVMTESVRAAVNN